jgi:hypothetical protein
MSQLSFVNRFCVTEGGTAGPSTTLRFGRDDKGEGCDLNRKPVLVRISVPATNSTLRRHDRIVIPTGADPDFLPRGTI